MKVNWEKFCKVGNGYKYHLEEVFYTIGMVIIFLFSPIVIVATWIADDVKRLITGKGFYEESKDESEQ